MIACRIKSFLRCLYRPLRPVYVPLALKYRRFCIQHQYPIKIMSATQTIAHIKECNCSISRYGDGELDMMLTEGSVGFQHYSAPLADHLRRVFKEADDRVLICLPTCVTSTRGMKKISADFWNNWNDHRVARPTLYRFLQQYGKTMYLFGDANITRPYMDWKRRSRATRIFKEIKSLWADKDIIIIEGEQTRLGVGNDLFSNAKSIKRILAPAKNAFDCYDQIKNTAIQLHHDELVLAALGPTATVLASDLSKLNIQTLDVGHIDVEYEWYLRNAKTKIPLPQKYVNEAKAGQNVANCEDQDYQKQIAARIHV